MVYGRRPFKRSGRRKLKATVPASTKKYVKRAIAGHIETKYFDAYLRTTPNNLTGPAIPISDTVVGVNSINRIGQRIDAQSVDIRWAVQVADPTNYVRIVVFIWHVSTLSASNLPQTDDIIDMSAYLTQPWMNNYQRLEARSQFTVLWDKTIRLDAVGPNTATGRKRINLKNHRITYTEDGSYTGKDKLYYVVVSDSSTLSHPPLDVVTRLRFKDA